MSGWKKAKIGEVSLGIYDGPHATPAPCETPGPYFLGIPQISPMGFIDMASPRYIAERDYGAWTKRVVPQYGDVVFSYEATLNLYALIPRDFKCCLGRRMGLVRPNPKKLDFQFLYYYFFSPEWRGMVRENTITGATVDRLSIAAFPSFEIALPPLPTQRRIASILSDYDFAIDNARRQIALLEEAAMRLYREWFVVNADPKWEKGAVRKWFEVTIGRTPPRKIAANFSEVEADQKWCSIKDLQNSSIFISKTAERLTKLGVDSSKIHISPPGTVFLSFKLTVGKVAITLEPMATNEAIAHFETTNRALRDYTYCYLHEFQYDTLGSTSSIGKAINSEIVRDMPFVMPDSKTMARFSETVSPIFDQIQNCVISIRALTEARDRLLPKLMSGEIEV